MTYLAGHGNSENKSVISISGYWIQSGTNMWIIQLHFFWRQNYCAYSLAIILVSLYFLLPVNNVSGNKQCGDYQPFIQEVFLPIFSVWLWSPAEAFCLLCLSVKTNRTYLHLLLGHSVYYNTAVTSPEILGKLRFWTLKKGRSISHNNNKMMQSMV